MTRPHTTKTIEPSSAEALRDVGRAILGVTDRHTPLYHESPPEATIRPLMRLVFHPWLEQGALDLRFRERLVLPGTPPKEVEVDTVLHVPATDATAAVEIDSHAWHRRTATEHEEEIERDRRIRGCYPLVRYSAREVLRYPWGVVLDLAEQMRQWAGFEGIELTPALRALCEACASVPGDAEEDVHSPSSGEEASTPVPTLEHARQVASQLAPPPPTVDPAIRQLRAAYPRHYALWEDAETELLKSLFQCWVDVEVIARILGRTPPAVWRQIGRMGLIEA